MFRNDENKLTISELRQFKGFENIPEDEATNIIDTLYKLTLIAFNEIIKNSKDLKNE